MKLSKVILMFAVVSLVAGSVFATEPTGGLRYSITVTKFDNKAGWAGQWDIGDAWATVLTDQLNQTGKFIVVRSATSRTPASMIRPMQIPAFLAAWTVLVVDVLLYFVYVPQNTQIDPMTFFFYPAYNILIVIPVAMFIAWSIGAWRRR